MIMKLAFSKHSLCDGGCFGDFYSVSYWGFSVGRIGQVSLVNHQGDRSIRRWSTWSGWGRLASPRRHVALPAAGGLGLLANESLSRSGSLLPSEVTGWTGWAFKEKPQRQQGVSAMTRNLKRVATWWKLGAASRREAGLSDRSAPCGSCILQKGRHLSESPWTTFKLRRTSGPVPPEETSKRDWAYKAEMKR